VSANVHPHPFDFNPHALDVEAGLHSELAEVVAAAERNGVALRDLRAVPEELELPRGRAHRRPDLRVVHTVGSDCAIGKMSAVLELDDTARRRGLRSCFVPTGQTGIAIAGWKIAVAHVVSDFVAGAAELLVDQGGTRGDLRFVEGQGALFHPAYSGVTLGLLRGTAADALVLAHKQGATKTYGYEDTPIPPLAELVQAYELMCALSREASVAAIALNTAKFRDDEQARLAIAWVEDETGLFCDDAPRFGADRLLDVVLKALPAALT
jgi:uncharacterized NAD-dependent epimerase/dehydratase family protein